MAARRRCDQAGAPAILREKQDWCVGCTSWLRRGSLQLPATLESQPPRSPSKHFCTALLMPHLPPVLDVPTLHFMCIHADTSSPLFPALLPRCAATCCATRPACCPAFLPSTKAGSAANPTPASTHTKHTYILPGTHFCITCLSLWGPSPRLYHSSRLQRPHSN